MSKNLNRTQNNLNTLCIHSAFKLHWSLTVILTSSYFFFSEKYIHTCYTCSLYF